MAGTKKSSNEKAMDVDESLIESLVTMVSVGLRVEQTVLYPLPLLVACNTVSFR